MCSLSPHTSLVVLALPKERIDFSIAGEAAVEAVSPH